GSSRPSPARPCSPPTIVRPSDDATRPHPAAPGAGGLLPRADGLPDPAGVPGDRLPQLPRAGREPEPAPVHPDRAVRPDERLHLAELRVLGRAARLPAGADDAADRRGAAVRDDRDAPDRARDRGRGGARQVAGRPGDVPGAPAAVPDLSAVLVLP